MHSIPGAPASVCVGASFTYHFPSKRMYAFTHGLASINYDRFAGIILKGAASASAFLIPSIIIQLNLEERLRALNSWHDKVYWNERKLGIRFDHHDNPDLASIDYTKLSKDLNAANTDFAYVRWSCKTTLRQLDFLDDVTRRYHTRAVAYGTPENEADEVKQLLLETHAQLRSWNAGLDDRAEYLLERVQAQVQTVSEAAATLNRLTFVGIQRHSAARFSYQPASSYDEHTAGRKFARNRRV